MTTRRQKTRKMTKNPNKTKKFTPRQSRMCGSYNGAACTSLAAKRKCTSAASSAARRQSTKGLVFGRTDGGPFISLLHPAASQHGGSIESPSQAIPQDTWDIDLPHQRRLSRLKSGRFCTAPGLVKRLACPADVVNAWGELGIYNDDARPENIMLKRITMDEATDYKAIASDFAQARVGMNDESDQKWKKHKYKRDEEGAVLAVMRGSRGLNLSQNYSWRTEGL